MAALHKNEKDMSISESYCCNCTRSETGMDSPYLREIAANIAERHCDLTGRHRYLREKITTMERSIPALMAYNMWIAGKNCEDAPYCKIRDFMKRLSPPDLDPTEKLLRNLKNAVKDLNKETTELHVRPELKFNIRRLRGNQSRQYAKKRKRDSFRSRIIDADVKLEETDMELESLELANKEMNDHADQIEKELRSYRGSSLHSINSEDLICLTKIYELAKEELELKNCIALLEDKEAVYAEQLDRLLTSKEFQTMSGNKGMLKRIQDLENNEKKLHCTLQFYKNNIQQLKKELVQKKCDRPVAARAAATISCQVVPERALKSEKCEDKSSVFGKISKQFGKRREKALKENTDDSCICLSKCKKSTKSLKKVLLQPKCSRGSTALKNPCSVDFSCDLPPCAIKSKCPIAPCPSCASSKSVKRSITNECVCNCKGKCAYGLSSVPCRCGIQPTCPLDRGYQPIAKSLTCLDDTGSDSDEYCECCSCGCENSDEN